MEAVGAASSVIAVIGLAAKVGSLCVKYLSAVKNARSEIKRLEELANHVEDNVKGVQQLLSGPTGNRLRTSQGFRSSLDSIESKLSDVSTKLEKRLNPGRRTKMMRLFGLQALVWPFQSEDVDHIMTGLQRDLEQLSTALQIDHV